MPNYHAPGLRLSESVAGADFARVLALVGTEFEIEPGKRYRYVQLSNSGGFGTGSGVDAAKEKVFEWVDQLAFTVKPANAATDRPAGVSPSETPNLANGDVFAVQIEGECYVVTASDGTLTAGQQVVGDDDTDLGKVTGSGGTTESQAAFAIALESVGTGDTRGRIRLNRKL